MNPNGTFADPDYDYGYDATTNTLYRQNKATGAWERYDPTTGTWVPASDPGFPSMGSLFGEEGGGSEVDNTYGLIAINGEVHPHVRIDDLQTASITQLNSTDTLDFYMVVAQNWELPTETDSDLLGDIGASNISLAEFDAGTGAPDAAVLKLNDITIGNLSRFMVAMGFIEIEESNDWGDWQIRYNAGSNEVRIRWNGTLIHTVDLD